MASQALARQPVRSRRPSALCVLAVLAAGGTPALTGAAQLPLGPTVVQGTASVATLGNQMTVTNSPGAVINWQGFSIGASQGVYFAQQSAASQVLNRVTGQDPSQILGSLASNGGVWLINPHGVLFGEHARVDVARLVATTLDIANADFLADRFRFVAAGPTGAEVVNLGDIRTSFGGRVWLIGENVRNEGRISAPRGEIVLAAGRNVELVDSGTPNLVVKVGAGQSAANLGSLAADGGRIDVHGAIVNQDGIVHADRVGTDARGRVVLQASEQLTLGPGSETRAVGGQVRLDASHNARVEGRVDVSDANGRGGSIAARAGSLVGTASASLRADGWQGGSIRLVGQGAVEIGSTLTAIGMTSGGTIELTGDAVRLAGATVDASGGQQGGVVHVGGGWQGGGELPQARVVSVDSGSVVRANGGPASDSRGGEVVLWSTQDTEHLGLLQALEGGRIEVSSKGLMRLTGGMEAGRGGTVLLDPKNLIVQDLPLGADYGLEVSEAVFSFDPSATSFIDPDTILAQLNVGTAVTLQANNDITVRSPVIAITPTPGDLTLQAGRSITFLASIDMSGGDLVAVAGDPGANPAFRDPGTPTITISPNAVITVPRGAATLAAIGGDFVNNAGDAAIQTAGSGRWLIYAADPATSLEGFSAYGKHYGQAYVPGVVPAYAGSGNWFLYGVEPVLAVTPGAETIDFGDPLPAFTPGYAGFIDGDSVATAGITGTPVWAVGGPFSAGGDPLPGPHDVGYLAGLASSLGYLFADNPASFDELTVMPPEIPAIDIVRNEPLRSRYPGERVATSIEATNETVSLVTVPLEPASGRVVDRTLGLICSTTNAFAAMDLAQMTREQAELLLELRKQCKKELYADAIELLEKDPTLADVPACSTSAQAATGLCRVTDAQRPPLPDAAKAVQKRAEPPPPARTAPLPQIERKIAVLFGINNYADRRIPTLDNSIGDAVAVGRLLRQKLGYDVRVVKNATKADIVRTLNQLAAEARPGDSVVVYYAGHGDVVKKTGRGYWIPADASPSDPRRWLSNDDISRMLKEVRAQQVAMISDSCYSGAFTKEEKLPAGVAQLRPETVLSRRSVVVMSSGGDEPVADSGKGGHSIFAWYLMQDLRQVEDWQAGTTLFPRVRRQVSRAFPQTPQYGAAISAGHEEGGDYLFEARQLAQ